MAASVTRCSSLDECYCNLTVTRSLVTRLGPGASQPPSGVWAGDLSICMTRPNPLSHSPWQMLNNFWQLRKTLLSVLPFLKVTLQSGSKLQKTIKGVLESCKLQSESQQFCNVLPFTVLFPRFLHHMLLINSNVDMKWISVSRMHKTPRCMSWGTYAEHSAHLTKYLGFYS